jgi:hypothetical protein
MFWILLRDKNKNGRPVSRVLYPEPKRQPDLYHLSGPAITDGIVQPTPPGNLWPESRWKQNEPLCLATGIYLVLQPMRRTASDVATRTGALLPHLFTLTPPAAGRLFSVTLLQAFTRLPVRKHSALCCPDFPHRFLVQERSDRAVCRCKGMNFKGFPLFRVR